MKIGFAAKMKKIKMNSQNKKFNKKKKHTCVINY